MRVTLDYPPEQLGYLRRIRTHGRSYHRHRHADLELNLVLSGTASYLVGGRREQFGPGSMAWLVPEQDHVVLDQSPEHELWVVVFRPELVARVCATGPTRALLGLELEGGPCRKLGAEDAARLNVLLEEVEAGSLQTLNAGLPFVLLRGWEIFAAARASESKAAIHPGVERAVRFLRKHPEVPSVEEIARTAGLSASRLSRLFRAEIGQSLVAFRNRQRLERFTAGLMDGEETTLVDAALRAGFGSYPQFYRVFTTTMGCTPYEYRRRMRRDTVPPTEEANDGPSRDAVHRPVGRPSAR